MEAKDPISRREFLKITGRIGLALGLGAGLSGLIGACRGTRETSHTIATIGDAKTTVSTSTTVSAEPGRELTIGVVSHKSGSSALFGRADEWWMRQARAACPQGVVCGDGRLHPVVFAVEDSRSDPTTAGRVAAKLIGDRDVDLVTCSGDVRLVNAVAARADSLGRPCISSLHHWRPFVDAQDPGPKGGRRWSFAHATGLEDVVADHVAMWSQVSTNSRVGLVLQDDIVGRLWSDPSKGIVPAATEAGYDCHSLGLVSSSSEYPAHIGEFSGLGCEVCCAVLPAGELAVFRRLCAELGYEPKVFSVGGGALMLPQVVESLGSRARNLLTESLWQPDWPYSDSITGKSAQLLAEEYMSTTGEMWAAPLAQYAMFEWAVDVFKRVTDLDDREAVAAQMGRTDLASCAGRIDLVGSVGGALGPGRPAPNVCKAPVAGVQWVARGSFELRPDTVANEGWPEIATTGSVQPMVY